MSAILLTSATPESCDTAQRRIISTAARVSRIGSAKRLGALPSAVNVTMPAPPTRSMSPWARRLSASCSIRSRSVDISCLPTNIPEHIDIDVTSLKIGDSIKVSDLQATDQYTMLTEAGQTLVVCAAPAKEETPEVTPVAGEAAAAAPAEPEVLKKGKAESEEEKESK